MATVRAVQLHLNKRFVDEERLHVLILKRNLPIDHPNGYALSGFPGGNP